MAARFFCALLLTLTGCGGSGGAGFVIVSQPQRQVAIEVAYVYSVQTTGAGGVTYELLAGPAGMTVSGAGKVEWNPLYGDLGTHLVRVRASDGATQVVQAWALRVHQGLALGVTLSPLGHTTTTSGQDFIDHYTNRLHGELVAFHSAWRDAVTDDGEIPILVQVAYLAADQYGYTPAVGVGWADGEGVPDLTSESDPGDNSWTNAETVAEFLAMVTDIALTYRPPYLFLGNETNSYFATHSAGEWAAWVSVHAAAYDAVKAASPQTVVSTVFQLERMKGLPPWSETPHWQLVDALEVSGKTDAVAFTSYPYFGFTTPGAIPTDYYDEIALHWSGPVIFTEIGWLSAPSPPFPGSEADQQAFVGTFFDRTRALDLEYVTWLFLHDWDGEAGLPAFAGIGFRDNLATTIRLADDAWQTEVLLRQRP